MDVGEFAGSSAAEIRKLIRDGRVSSVEVTRASLERLGAIDPDVRAFVEVREDKALAEARLISAGSPLAGVPVAVKKTDAAGVGARMLARAGAVVVGLTSVPAKDVPWQTWGHTERGPTRNPWRGEVTPGGSSAGSAVAVTTGIVPLATATDGAGSTRIPAAWCGIVGLKTTNGLLAFRDPAGLTAAGALGRTVGDAALHFDVISGAATTDALDHEPRGVRAVWAGGLGFQDCDPATARVARSAMDVLAGAGVVEPVDMGVELDDPHRAWHALRGNRGGAERTRRRNDERLRELFAKVGLLVTPTTPGPPHGHEGPGDAMTVGCTWAFNLSGHPAVSVPAGFADGLPVGVQLVAGHGREELLLRTAAALERLAPWPRWGHKP